MILMRANPLQEPLEGLGPENRDFFGLGSERSESHLGPKKSRFQGPPLPIALEMYFPGSKPLRPAPYKQQVH
jgi:hypothetical protein